MTDQIMAIEHSIGYKPNPFVLISNDNRNVGIFKLFAQKSKLFVDGIVAVDSLICTYPYSFSKVFSQ